MVSSGLAEGSRWPELPCRAQWWAPSCWPGVQAGTVLVHGQHTGPGQSRRGQTPNSHPCMGKVGACAWPTSQNVAAMARSRLLGLLPGKKGWKELAH